MSTGDRHLHFRAVRILFVTTLFWSLSFPVVKGLAGLQEKLLPGSHVLIHSGLTGFVRFFVSALILAVFCWSRLMRTTRSELVQGIGLGLFGGMGIILQMIGLSFTSASISAFLTQTFCIYIPIFVAIRDRKAPGARVIVSTILMILGVAVLNTLDFRSIHLGLGEWLTILAAIFFSGQILWLERPEYQKNDVMNATTIMFVVIALMSLPLIGAKMEGFREILRVYTNPGVLILTAVLIFFCTICAFVLMNKWQPYVPSTEAAMIYGFEPVWASMFALFLPGLMSAAFHLAYANEKLTTNLVIGGILILVSNLVLQLRWTTSSKIPPE